MKPTKKTSLTSPFSLIVVILGLIVLILFFATKITEQIDYIELLEIENKTLKELEKLPLQVKVLEPHITSISFDGIVGEIWWLEGSPLSESDFFHSNYTDFKSRVKGKDNIKVPPKAAAYVLRGRISKEGYTADHYSRNPKINPDTTPESNTY